MSSTVKREKGIGEEAWGAVGFWKVVWNAEEEGSPKGNASPPRQGPCRVGRLSFGAHHRRGAIVILSKTTLASRPGPPPLRQSAAVCHLSQCASNALLFLIGANHIWQIVGWSGLAWHFCPYATPKSAFCRPALHRSQAGNFPGGSANTRG